MPLGPVEIRWITGQGEVISPHSSEVSHDRNHGGMRARLVALALLLAAPVLGVDLGDPAQAASAVTTQTIQLDPKVDGGGTTPRRASAAAARLAVRVDCTGTCASTYPVEVQRRPAGDWEPWERVWSGTVVKGSDKVLRGRRCCEYRMRYRIGSGWQAWSAVESYRWTRTFVDEFSTGSLDPAKWAHRRPGQQHRQRRHLLAELADAVAFTSNTMKVSSLVDPDPEPPASYTQAQLDFCARARVVPRRHGRHGEPARRRLRLVLGPGEDVPTAGWTHRVLAPARQRLPVPGRGDRRGRVLRERGKHADLEDVAQLLLELGRRGHGGGQAGHLGRRLRPRRGGR